MQTLFLLFAVSLHVAAVEKDQAKPNTLTPKEVADGWISLFDGETTFGWKVEGDAKVEDGVLMLGGEKKTTARLTTGFGPCEYRMEFRLEGKDAKFKWGGIAPAIKFGDYNDQQRGWSTYALTLKENTSSYRLRSPSGKLGIEVINSPFGTKGNSLTPPGENPQPQLFLPVFDVAAGSKVLLRGIKLKPMSLPPIFNGKDLTGWKEVPDKKSKFTVTDKGELNIKDGPGDIQTEGQWDDFVLQLDCFSNGKHLNSGVFFRCLPGQFWSGYEAQVRNQWQGDDRAKPVDYGTGGIYNLQPARKVVSSDKEWFAMTIVANGNHLAVWVNGYQTADYTDNRPANKSARKGSKTDKGPISLQGHDPTTDLSFRNIRIAELPRAEKK